jgi:chloramphenicol-sensitive protein RarD
MGEPMPLERWIGFALVWLALVLLSADALTLRRNRLFQLAETP